MTGAGSILASSGHDITFNSSSLSVSGAGSIQANSSHDVTFNAGTTLALGGPGSIRVSSGNDITANNGSTLTASGTPLSIDFVSGRFLTLHQTSIVSAPNGTINLSATNDIISEGNLTSPNINFSAGDSIGIGQGTPTLGMAGVPTNLNLTAGTGSGGQFLEAGLGNGTVTVVGQGINVSVNAPNFAIQNGGVVLQTTAGSTFQVNATNIAFPTAATLSSTAPAAVSLTASGAIAAPNATISVPASGSSVSLVSGGSLAVGNIQSGGALSASSGGNIQIGGSWSGSTVSLVSAGDLIGPQPPTTTPTPALTASNSLSITASSIFGNLTNSTVGASNAFAFTTGANATGTINVTGANDTALGGHAASLYYALPQSPNLQFVHSSSGDIALVEPSASSTGGGSTGSGSTGSGSTGSGSSGTGSTGGTGSASTGSSTSSSATIVTRSQLSPALAQAATQSTASANPAVGNPEPVAASGSLGSDNPGLTSFASVSVTSPVLETVLAEPGSVPGARASAASATEDESTTDVRLWRKWLQRILIWEDPDQ